MIENAAYDILSEVTKLFSNFETFRYYSTDHYWIQFRDFVYKTLFWGTAVCEQIWHLAERTLKQKYLHIEIRFVEYNFSPDVYENDRIILLTLRWKATSIGYLRNNCSNRVSPLHNIALEDVNE